MSHTFQKINASSSFKKIKESTDAGDFIKNKIDLLTYCNNKSLKKCDILQCKKTGWSDGDYLSYKNGKQIVFNSSKCNQFNPYDLYYSLLVVEDLKNIDVLSDVSYNKSPVVLNINDKPLYNFVNIDPDGSLFGKTECGLYNSLYYRR